MRLEAAEAYMRLEAAAALLRHADQGRLDGKLARLGARSLVARADWLLEVLAA